MIDYKQPFIYGFIKKNIRVLRATLLKFINLNISLEDFFLMSTKVFNVDIFHRKIKKLS